MAAENSSVPSDEIVDLYSDYKAAIFSRYRTLSELMGAVLLKQAQKINISCLMETSGRDIAMFHYVDHFFDAAKYNKLALHFTINDLSHAQESVDKRMIKEIQIGAKAVQNEDAFEVVYANAGGPYGSKVLKGVQEDSEKVWQEKVLKGEVGEDWFKVSDFHHFRRYATPWKHEQRHIHNVTFSSLLIIFATLLAPLGHNID